MSISVPFRTGLNTVQMLHSIQLFNNISGNSKHSNHSNHSNLPSIPKKSNLKKSSKSVSKSKSVTKSTKSKTEKKRLQLHLIRPHHVNHSQSFVTHNHSLQDTYHRHATTPYVMASTQYKLEKKFNQLAKRFKQIHGHKPRVFVACTGNTCRSASAVALLSRMFGNSISISSAGTNVRTPGSKMTSYVHDVLTGAVLHGKQTEPIIHSSRDISVAMKDILEADLILVMEQKHADAILSMYPQLTSPIVILHVPDPYRDPEDAATKPMSSLIGENFDMTQLLLEKLDEVMTDFFESEL
jgi:protein-tyrosine-phosphatase